MHTHTYKVKVRVKGRRQEGQGRGSISCLSRDVFSPDFLFSECNHLFYIEKKKKKDSISANIFLLFISNKMAIKSANGLSFFPELKHIFFNITNLIRVFKLLRKVL